MKFKIFLALVVLILSYGALRLNELNHKQTYSEFNFNEIYVFGVIMSVAALPILPEVSREHIGLMTNDGKTVFGNGSFFLKSKVVSAAIDRSCRLGANVTLNWDLSNYELKLEKSLYIEARSALALNGGIVSCENRNPIARINVRYPKRTLVTLIRIYGYPIFQIEEGMFGALQEKGWYKPYTFQWSLREL